MSLFIEMRRVIALLAASSLLPAAEHHGSVKFGGLPLPGATVTATLGDKRVSTVSDPQGTYTFADLATGVWKVRVEMQCFVPLEKDAAVQPDAPSPEWEMQLLPFEQIKASAPPPPPPSATPAAPPATVSQQKFKKLPKGLQAPQAANTNSGFQRTQATASATAPKEKEEAAKETAPAEMTAAAPSDGFLINGSVNNGAASPFAQSAAFGNFRRRPGSLYNGSLGLVFDNSFWNARSYSLTGQDTPKPNYSRVQGLASFGGPIKIPHIVFKERPNLTVNYQWLRNRNANTASSLMPTAAERAGDFSASTARLLDPLNNAPLPGNQIPQSRISPQARALAAFYPLPNFISSRYNYQTPLVGSTHSDAMQMRLGKSLTKKDQASGSFGMQSTRTDDTNLFGFLDNSRTLGMMTNVNWMHRFGMRMFTNLSYQFSRQSSHTTPFFAGRTNVSAAAGITGNNQDSINWGPPALNFASGIASLNDARASASAYQTNGITASIFRSQGSHNFTTGGSFRRQQFNLISQQDPRGTFTFTGATTGKDFASFLLGMPDTSSIAFGNADKYFRSSGVDLYLNDDYRVSPSLTINGGIRWEYGSPITELYGRLVNLDIGPGYSAIAPVLAGNPVGSLTGRTFATSLLQPFKHAIQPRIGLSWRPMLASSMVIRAGYGIYYDTSIYLPIAIRMAQQPPLSKSLSVANSAANPLTLASGFNAPANVNTNTYAVDPNLRAGYTHTWQASMQRDLPASLVMTATYLGTKGSHSQQQFLPHTYPTGAVSPCPSCPSGYAYLTSGGNSTRESGQLQLRRRLHSGFTASLNYTLAKSMDNASLGGKGQGSAVIAQDWLNLDGERGRSNFDQRHALTAQVQYTTGMGLKGGTLLDGWRGRMVKDWTFLTNITAGSGMPLTPVYLSPVRGTGISGSIRPDYTGASLYDAPAGLFLNPAAVVTPAIGRWGNAGRNSIDGPAQFSLNASMARTFRLSDKFNTDFRLDSVNTLNHVTYPRWNVTSNSAQFGLPSSANPMRNLQATLRVRF